MNGFHFFAAMPESRGSKSTSKTQPHRWTRKTVKTIVAAGGFVDCVAVHTDRISRWYDSRAKAVMIEAATGIFDHENSAVCGSSVSADWLRKRAVRIDEATARKAHPALFEYLDD